MNHQIVLLRERFKKISSPQEARQLLHQALDLLISVDKHLLQDFILYLRQIATDLQFSHYHARCQYILIPPEDALTFWINHVLGHCPEEARFAYFEGEIHELLKVLDMAQIEENKLCLPRKQVSTAVAIFKDKYPGFLTGLTREPFLIPIMNLSIQGGSVLCWPQYHCFALFASQNDEEQSLISILHSLVHLIHYQLTEDLSVLPPGFINLQRKLYEEPSEIQSLIAEGFAEIITASLLYDTEYMPLVAYMEFNLQQHEEICHYLSWLQVMFFSGFGDNVKQMMSKHQQKLQA